MKRLQLGDDRIASRAKAFTAFGGRNGWLRSHSAPSAQGWAAEIAAPGRFEAD